ncbi:DEAD/DEAH box helicase [Candidatus Peregrinibacteria bacterium]|jgi:ATP-dependent RNA helicase RhlE|nr:DEAD/DEAH box helicase [Candidatus Peregrinibacteria bacterium]MBT4148355.1 DEAD/DEAH box helicase [Candidatus Peregrinibacteria bacterium]MBT4366678.1 DEAD/DEAH box helicase [Candidatus Peregrinibacteria bacterium]MBT4455892.1 DEAD/DEAH box helicase [Candidatus Peregrinibacteria bacterium]
MTFENLNIIQPILEALKRENYVEPTPIQAQSIPAIMQGRDIFGCAQTGTGKTAAFAIPILQNIKQAQNPGQGKRSISALILAPTRELAIQISEKFSAYGKSTGLRHAVIYGGVSQFHQVKKLKAGVDIVIATPGRLMDLMNQGYVDLRRLKILTLDEADRMLDMGFINDIKKIIAKVPAKRQTLFFSATMPAAIKKLSETILTDPVRISISPVNPSAENITQELYYVEKGNKKNLLIHVLEKKSISSALIFTRTKRGADKITRQIKMSGIRAEAIHGNKSQNYRQKALANFKAKKTTVLVATDIASRGIDIDELSHVINYEIPNEAETYVHRIGRTGRAGASGIALSFCAREEQGLVRDINRLINSSIPIVTDHPFRMTDLQTFGGGGNGRRPRNRFNSRGGGQARGGRNNHSRRRR